MAQEARHLCGEALNIITLLDCVNDLDQVRMRSVETLTECDHRSGQNIRAFHSDGNWQTHVPVSDHITRISADASSAHHIHCYNNNRIYRYSQQKVIGYFLFHFELNLPSFTTFLDLEVVSYFMTAESTAGCSCCPSMELMSI